MKYIVSPKALLQKVVNASNSQEGCLDLRNFVFDYYAGEDEYVFTSERLEKIFAVLLPYLHFEEAFGDQRRALRLRLMEQILREDLSPESAVLGLEYDQISALSEKLESGLIPESVFETQLRKISPADVDWNRVLTLYRSHPEFRACE
jgi:hypothetical protein